MKKLVVCCDGTGNEVSENISNVLKFYRALRKTEKTEPQQIVFYDPGVGTLARPDPWTKVYQNSVTALGLATGRGLDNNVLNAYKFLITNYEEGDEIYLFGFSRGAYTVRILAAFIHKIGLLFPQQSNLADAALTAYKQSTERRCDSETANDSPVSIDDRAAQFARIVFVRWPNIKFVGVWDTVASVIVPRPYRYLAFAFEELPNTRRNPSIRIFRQAAAIDERRRMFRLHRWHEPQIYTHNRFSGSTKNAEAQDIKQVWFAGVHADIGGGYPEVESNLSKYPLLWMIEEATTHGLNFNQQVIRQLAWGVLRQGSPFSYVKPDHKGSLHQSLAGAWRLMELLPKSDRYKEWTQTRSRFGYYIPNAEPRAIPENAYVHESAHRRIKELDNYRPANLPKQYRLVPIPAGP